MTRHFINLYDLDGATLRGMLDDAAARKAARRGWPKGKVDADAAGRDRVLAMIFEKNSTRTRYSFDAAIRQLGGDSIIATAGDMQLGRGESVADTAKVLSRMVDAVMIRSNAHATIEDFAAAATAPVINGLSDLGHPCQIMADLVTFEEHRGLVTGKTLAWVGDGNNVCASFMHCAAQLDFTGCASPAPKAYAPEGGRYRRRQTGSGARSQITHDAQGGSRQRRPR